MLFFFVIIAFLFSAFSVIVQYYFSVIQKIFLNGFKLSEFLMGNLGYIYYFTMQSNLLVFFVYLSVILKIRKFVKDYSNIKKLINPSLQSAVAVYILIVAIVYNIFLRKLWNPTGLKKIEDNFLHVINPIIYIVFWFIFLDRESFYKKSFFYYSTRWIIYPLIYLFVVCFIGYFIGRFPYPFLNFYKIGVENFIINIILLILFFFLISFLIYIFGKISLKRQNNCI